MNKNAGFLGLRSGIGLVVANMIGAGVFLSAGFMAQDMGPGPLLLAWLFGAGLALCGARAYAEIAGMIGRSGGEYRYLSELLHPSMGYLAGWGSLLLGFAAPIALDAYAAGAFLDTLIPGFDPRVIGTALILGLTVMHALHTSASKWTQNVLVLIKLTFVIGFVGLGLAVGSNAWPEWEAPNAPVDGSFPFGAFMENQFWIAFAFSGWNAAIYAAGEFRQPKRDVPWAMLIGCGGVAILYVLVNWVFVANLTPDQASAVFEHESTRVTLGHLVVGELVGPLGASVMSVFAILAFTSAMSAMTLVGPRVYAEMACDGYLPKFLAGKGCEPPVGSLALQAALALGLLWTHSILQVVESAGGILMVFSGLTVLCLFKVRFFRPDLPRPANISLVAAGIYSVAASGILYYGFRESAHLLPTIAGVAIIGLLAWALTRTKAPATEELPALVEALEKDVA